MLSNLLVMLVMIRYAQLGYKRFAREPFPRYFIFRRALGGNREMDRGLAAAFDRAFSLFHA
jgi:hypothetical protein